MFQPDKKIGSLSRFLQQIDKLGVDGTELRYFRGHSKTSFELKPSIFRNSGWINNEATMLKELILRCPEEFDGRLTTFQCLVKMQHYGLPTRLLDVTSNPLVALYFACELHSDSDEDGEVIVFDFDVSAVKYFDSDTVSVVANLARRPRDFMVPDQTPNTTFNEEESIKLLLHDIGDEKPHFVPKIRPADLSRVVCVKPKLSNARIVRQEGAFLLYGCDKFKVKPAKLADTTIVARLVINRDEKRNLRDQLGALGISRATMFPEIEQVATHIKESYFVPSVDLSRQPFAKAKVLQLLYGTSSLSVKDVATSVGIAAATASRLISEMREAGIVEPIGSGSQRRWRIAKRLDIVGTAKGPTDA